MGEELMVSGDAGIRMLVGALVSNSWSPPKAGGYQFCEIAIRNRTIFLAVTTRQKVVKWRRLVSSRPNSPSSHLEVSSLLLQTLRDELRQELVWPQEDLNNLSIPHVLFHGIFFGIPIGAHDLYALGGDLHGHVGRKDLCHV
jgi:hypothetical protein